MKSLSSKMKDQRQLCTYKARIGAIPRLLSVKRRGSIKHEKPSLLFPNTGNTQPAMMPTPPLSNHILIGQEEAEILLHAEMLVTAFRLLQNLDLCYQTKTKDGTAYRLVLPSEIWNEDLTLKSVGNSVGSGNIELPDATNTVKNSVGEDQANSESYPKPGIG